MPTANHDPLAQSGDGRRSATGRWLAALDTATDQAGVALFDGERLAEFSWPGGRQQTTTVLPALERLLADQALTIGDIGAVAVAAGPGSFTGLRVGLSLAKGLAVTGRRAVVGVDTLEVAAAPFLEAGLSCVALVPAGRGRVVWAAYGPGLPPPLPANASFDEFFHVLADHPDAIVAGELTADQYARVKERHGKVSTFMGLRRPGVLARIGFARWRAGEVDDPILLEPLYLHGLLNPR